VNTRVTTAGAELDDASGLSLLKSRLPRSSCHVRIEGAGVGAKHIRGEVRDISPSGLCLVTPLVLTRGSTLHLSFRLPTGHIEAVGEVRWVRREIGQPYELGIRFVRISLTATRAIMATINGQRVGPEMSLAMA